MFSSFSCQLFPTDSGKYSQVAEFDFENGTDDLYNNISSTALNGARIVYDEERKGNVLSFSAENKGCLRLDTNPLSDTLSISFWGKREDTAPMGSWRMFMAFYAEDGSNLYLTPLTSWGNNSYLILEHKGYASYKSISGKSLDGGWHHFVLTFTDNILKYYVDGELQAELSSLFKLSDFQFTKFYFGCNPELNYPMSGKIDDLKIFHYNLYDNQVKALFRDEEIPEPDFLDSSMLPGINLTVDFNEKFQTICNFGASDGWNAQTIGLYFPEQKKERIAEMLFSTDTLANGTPKGIGLSSWRFNIGAGTAEQGDNSRIVHFSRRTECFLNPDKVTYDWNKQAGQQWFLKKVVKTYKVPDIIGWQNSPPVYFTKRGLGFREYGDPKSSILKKENYADFGRFLANVFNHFKEEGIDFKYLSPLNEPQWDWAATAVGATVAQEGTPWMNQDITEVVKAIDKTFAEKGITTQQFITEAGAMNYLLNSTTGYYGNQLNTFWNTSSPLKLTGLPSFSNFVSTHSYWADDSAENIVNMRNQLRDQLKSLNNQLSYWQTEYCLLGYGYKFGHENGMERTLSPMECAISMARIIHNDLAEANATAWQWWTTFEFDSMAGAEDRFALIRFELNKAKTDGVYRTSKLLYGLGNYSRFIRPGMQRTGLTRSDGTDAVTAVTNQMFSSYSDGKQIVIVAVNTRKEPVPVTLNISNLPENSEVKTFRPYVTSENPMDNIQAYPEITAGSEYVIPGMSIVTFVGNISNSTGLEQVSPESYLIYPNPASDFIHIKSDNEIKSVVIRDISGKTVSRKKGIYASGSLLVGHLNKGVYIISIESESGTYNQKIQVK